MKKGFEVSYTIGYFEVDGDLFLTPSSLAVYLQDAAILHSDSIGYTIDYFNNGKKGWVIINWHIDIIRMPQKGETIRVCTWSDECKRMQAERSFVVYDENEIPVAKAMSKWIFMDLERRRPVKINEDMAERYSSLNVKAIENENYKMIEKDENDIISQRVFTVTRRDTDSNGHTNNTKYIEWAIDDVPDDIYYNYKVSDIRVVYRKECYKNSCVKGKCYLVNLDDDKKCVVSTFTDNNNDKEVFAEISTIWEKC